MYQRFIFILMLLVPASASRFGDQSSREEALTLQQAVALAMENNRLVKNAGVDSKQ